MKRIARWRARRRVLHAKTDYERYVAARKLIDLEGGAASHHLCAAAIATDVIADNGMLMHELVQKMIPLPLPHLVAVIEHGSEGGRVFAWSVVADGQIMPSNRASAMLALHRLATLTDGENRHHRRDANIMLGQLRANGYVDAESEPTAKLVVDPREK